MDQQVLAGVLEELDDHEGPGEEGEAREACGGAVGQQERLAGEQVPELVHRRTAHHGHPDEHQGPEEDDPRPLPRQGEGTAGIDAARVRPRPLHHEEHAVVAAPEDVGPGGAVPEPAEGHHDEHVPVGDQAAAPVAAEGDVEVVAEPRREAHVPAQPEVAGPCRQVGQPEVEQELEPHQLRQPAGDVGVAREVTVDVDREAEHGHEGSSP